MARWNEKGEGMIKVGNPPYLECSSRGDTRFSAFYARPKSLNGRSIEVAYQAGKIFRDGTTELNWRAAKGKSFINIAEMWDKYFHWWEEWIYEQNLMQVLKDAQGLSDIFGIKGHTCQAEILWMIRNQEKKQYQHQSS